MTGAAVEIDAGQLELLRSGLQIMALRALGDAEAAEEAAQETLVRAFDVVRSGRRFDPRELGAFVGGIARHVIADVRRERQRIISLQSLPDGPVARLEDPLAALVSAAERARLRDALAGLSHGDWELLRLSFFEAVTPTQLAQRLGEPVERIRKRKSRALERLRRAFFGEGRGHGA